MDQNRDWQRWASPGGLTEVEEKAAHDLYLRHRAALAEAKEDALKTELDRIYNEWASPGHHRGPFLDLVRRGTMMLWDAGDRDAAREYAMAALRETTDKSTNDNLRYSHRVPEAKLVRTLIGRHFWRGGYPADVEWAEVRRRQATFLLEYSRQIDEMIDRDWPNWEHPPRMPLSSEDIQGAVIFQSQLKYPIPLSSVKEEARPRYQEWAGERMAFMRNWARQSALRRLRDRVYPMIEEHLAEVYAQPPGDLDELRAMLDEHGVEEEMRQRIIRSVQERIETQD